MDLFKCEHHMHPIWFTWTPDADPEEQSMLDQTDWRHTADEAPGDAEFITLSAKQPNLNYFIGEVL